MIPLKQHLSSVDDVCWPDGGPSKTLSIGTKGTNGKGWLQMVKDGLSSLNDVCWLDGFHSKTLLIGINGTNGKGY